MIKQEHHQQIEPFCPKLQRKISPKVTILQKTSLYSELDLFRKQQYRPYEVHKKKARNYQAIFLSIGFIFFILMIFISFQQTSWFYNLYIGHYFFTKISLCAICGFSAGFTTFFAIQIRPEKEAVGQIFRRAKYRINRIYLRKRACFGLKGLLFFLYDCHEAELLKHIYEESLDRMHETKEATLLLLEQIAQASELELNKRADLFNQALLELREKLNANIQSFK